MLTTALVRRAAEAADGYRTGEPVWVSVDASDLTRVDVFTSEDAARAASHANVVTLGPFQHEADPRAVEAVSVTIRTADGSERTIALDPSVDAIFFSSSSIDKFLVPYYSKLYEPAVVEALSRADQLPMGHDRNTRWLPL